MQQIHIPQPIFLRFEGNRILANASMSKLVNLFQTKAQL